MMHRQREIAWGAALGIAVGLVTWSPQLLAAEEAAQAKAPSSSTTNIAAKAGEKIAHTFPDDAKMGEFKKTWQQRQGVLVRMSVLQAYWNEEQALLDQLNHTLSSDYGLDTAKSYALDGARRVLIEQETPPAPPSAASNPNQPPPSQKP